ncbi:hypothetical protein [Hydrocarboniphaga effusa]|uniref:hypothetical protein n=1 Tax=Hydrocarboniphaga effusa TaxID=243629 RepID=UPI00398C2213
MDSFHDMQRDIARSDARTDAPQERSEPTEQELETAEANVLRKLFRGRDGAELCMEALCEDSYFFTDLAGNMEHGAMHGYDEAWIGKLVVEAILERIRSREDFEQLVGDMANELAD